MSPEEQARIAGWLRETDIALLELTGPHGHTRIENDSPEFAKVPAGLPPSAIITSQHVGMFLAAHPLRRHRLVSVGTMVEGGQPLGLLQIGPLLLPVTAPSRGVVLACLVTDQALVGYGTAMFEFRPL